MEKGRTSSKFKKVGMKFLQPENSLAFRENYSDLKSEQMEKYRI